ncbi:MAG: hypothetical protein RDV41_16125, partial [Planctomycetota bacterium]|nr:hypothetical protein [Planctomycetota bacterium]
MKTDPGRPRPDPAGDDMLHRNVDRVAKHDPNLFRKLETFLAASTVDPVSILKRFTAAQLTEANAVLGQLASLLVMGLAAAEATLVLA